MKTVSCTRAVLPVFLAALALTVVPATAQIVIETVPGADVRPEGIRPDGLVLEVGAAAPTHGDRGLLFGVSAGMGTLLSRHLDFSLGLRHWSADIDRSDLGADTDGTFSDTSLDAVLTYPLMRIKGLRPYLGAGLAGHSVGADIPGDRSLEDALSGVNFGALAVVGIGTTKPGLGARLQLRRDFVEDVGAWSYSLGVGWWPKVRAEKTYRPDDYGSEQQDPYRVNYTPAPVTPAPATPAPTTTGQAERNATEQEMVTALNHLKQQNDAMAARLAQLQQKVDEAEAAPPVLPVTPAPAPVVEPVAPAAPTPDRSTVLFDALDRVTTLAGNPGSLRREGDTGLLTLDQSLLFASGASRLTVGAREELRRIGVVLLRFPEAEIVVQGHTDAIGRPETNATLSERRASAVRDELLAIGIRPGTIRAVGYGDTRPVASNDTPDGRARNRRVDLLITMPSSAAN